jgi:hypothetical protein
MVYGKAGKRKGKKNLGRGGEEMGKEASRTGD